MAQSTIQQEIHEIKVLYKNFSMSAGQNNLNNAVPDISAGYKFLCWIGSATIGAVCSSYITNMNDDTANVWIINPPSYAYTLRLMYLVYR